MELIKRHWKKIVIILFALLFLNTCTKSCSKSNEIRKYQYELDSLVNTNKVSLDSIATLQDIIKERDFKINVYELQLNEKNERINDINRMYNSAMQKNTTIRLSIPETKKDE